MKIKAVTFPPTEAIGKYLMQQAKHEDLRSLYLFTDNDQLLRLVAFGYDLCGINTLDDFNAEDKGWKEVFTARCRKIPQVIAWIEKVLQVAKSLQAAYVSNNDDDLV